MCLNNGRHVHVFVISGPLVDETRKFEISCYKITQQCFKSMNIRLLKVSGFLKEISASM